MIIKIWFQTPFFTVIRDFIIFPIYELNKKNK